MENENGWGAFYEALSTEQLVDEVGFLREALEPLAAKLSRVEYEIISRMDAEGATAVPHKTHVVKLERRVTYDQGKLASLREVLPAEVHEAAWTPERQETRTVPGRWDMRKVAGLKRYGADVVEVIERAAIPGAPRLTIKLKEANSGNRDERGCADRA